MLGESRGDGASRAWRTQRRWVGDGRAKPPPLGSTSAPDAPGERKREQDGAAGSARRRFQNFFAPGASPGGWSSPGGRGEQAQVHSGFPGKV